MLLVQKHQTVQLIHILHSYHPKILHPEYFINAIRHSQNWNKKFLKSMIVKVSKFYMKFTCFVKPCYIYYNFGFVGSVILNCLLDLVASCINSCNCPICSSRKSLSFSSERGVPKHAFPVEFCLFSLVCCHNTAA